MYAVITCDCRPTRDDDRRRSNSPTYHHITTRSTHASVLIRGVVSASAAASNNDLYNNTQSHTHNNGKINEYAYAVVGEYESGTRASSSRSMRMISSCVRDCSHHRDTHTILVTSAQHNLQAHLRRAIDHSSRRRRHAATGDRAHSAGRQSLRSPPTRAARRERADAAAARHRRHRRRESKRTRSRRRAVWRVQRHHQHARARAHTYPSPAALGRRQLGRLVCGDTSASLWCVRCERGADNTHHSDHTSQRSRTPASMRVVARWRSVQIAL
jgi:hypothetical protein